MERLQLHFHYYTAQSQNKANGTRYLLKRKRRYSWIQTTKPIRSALEKTEWIINYPDKLSTFLESWQTVWRPLNIAASIESGSRWVNVSIVVQNFFPPASELQLLSTCDKFSIYPQTFQKKKTEKISSCPASVLCLIAEEKM